MTHKFSLVNDDYIIIEKTEEGRDIFLFNEIINRKDLIAQNNNGKWLSISHDFFKLAKRFPSSFKHNIHKSLDENYQMSIGKQRNRRWRKIKIFFNKLIK